MESDKHIYPEEIYANKLHERLQKETFVSELDAKVTVLGTGVHWQCVVSRNDVLSEIHCFNEGVYGPQYLTFFKSKGEKDAVLRTNSVEETVSSVSTWLYYSDIKTLYQRHPTVDESKRNLTYLYQVIESLDPILTKETEHKLFSSGDDFCDLRFLHENRCCVISAADHFENHLVLFQEDEVQICSFREQAPEIIAQALKFWLAERYSPSMFGREFESLVFSEVAIYYEIGRPIIGEFIQSWNSTERFFLNNRSLESGQAYVLLTKIRTAGYDRTLRAGQSLMTLILSRSRRHGLQKGQPRIYLDFRNNEIIVRYSFLEEEAQEIKFSYYSSKEPPSELINILDKLVSFPIT